MYIPFGLLTSCLRVGTMLGIEPAPLYKLGRCTYHGSVLPGLLLSVVKQVFPKRLTRGESTCYDLMMLLRKQCVGDVQ